MEVEGGGEEAEGGGKEANMEAMRKEKGKILRKEAGRRYEKELERESEVADIPSNRLISVMGLGSVIVPQIT